MRRQKCSKNGLTLDFDGAQFCARMADADLIY
jgi:hypothetical protein